MHDGIINRVAIEHCSIRCKYLPVEFGAEHCALEMFRVVVPVSDQDVLPGRGLDEGQSASQDLGVGGALNRLVGLELDSHHKNGSGFGFPQKSLVSTPVNFEMFELCKAMCCVMDDQDAPMGTVIVAVGMSWIAESMPSSDFKVLAHRMMFLLVQVRFNQHIDLTHCLLPNTSPGCSCRRP